jgi:cytochrome c-type biogenesis protein
MVQLTIIAAFLAGFISFLSPCVLPLIPGFLAYLAGTSLKEPNRKEMFLHSLIFVLGFSVIFAILGVILNTLTDISDSLQSWLARIAGLVIILFALHLLGLLHIPFLEKEHKLKVKLKANYFTSFVFGAAFAVGWTPCVGAILGSILALAITSPGLSFWLLMSYALGLGIPFLLVGLFSDKAVKLISKSDKFLKYFNIVVGALLLIIGILVFTNNLNLVANFEILNQFLLK